VKEVTVTYLHLVLLDSNETGGMNVIWVILLHWKTDS